jgi:hypothetical protein
MWLRLLEMNFGQQFAIVSHHTASNFTARLVMHGAYVLQWYQALLANVYITIIGNTGLAKHEGTSRWVSAYNVHLRCDVWESSN